MLGGTGWGTFRLSSGSTNQPNGFSKTDRATRAPRGIRIEGAFASHPSELRETLKLRMAAQQKEGILNKKNVSEVPAPADSL